MDFNARRVLPIVLPCAFGHMGATTMENVRPTRATSAVEAFFTGSDGFTDTQGFSN